VSTKVETAGEQLFASFVVDQESGMEVALRAEHVMEAIRLTEQIRPLPNGISFVEGVMQLRQEVMPVINMKKRLGLQRTQLHAEAKVAVVHLQGRQFGLLFDDIRDVLRVPGTALRPLDEALLTEDRIITGLITLADGRRNLDVINLGHLFPGGLAADADLAGECRSRAAARKTYSRFVVFSCFEQKYGLRVEDAQEICFPSELDEMFKSGVIEGALQLRGHTIPVLAASRMLSCSGESSVPTEDTRILVLTAAGLHFGMLVDQVKEILTVADEEIKAMPGKSIPHIRGLYHRQPDNILLLNIAELVEPHSEIIRTMARKDSAAAESVAVTVARHLITENCYLIFRAGRHYAIELKDVQEIIESEPVLTLPEGTGWISGILNLRGAVVPVLDLRRFLRAGGQGKCSDRLIIAREGDRLLALVVDEIVTIFKQEQFYKTPSLRPELQDRRDALDRLIEFVNHQEAKEHVLVVNIYNIIHNHLALENNLVHGSEAIPG
jgi:purine-binding chemotaxis protein CheW